MTKEPWVDERKNPSALPQARGPQQLGVVAGVEVLAERNLRSDQNKNAFFLSAPNRCAQAFGRVVRAFPSFTQSAVADGTLLLTTRKWRRGCPVVA